VSLRLCTMSKSVNLPSINNKRKTAHLEIDSAQTKRATAGPTMSLHGSQDNARRPTLTSNASPRRKTNHHPKKENIFLTPEERAQKEKIMTDMELDMCLRNMKNNANYFKQYAATKSDQDLTAISKEHNSFLRKKGWTRVYEKPDPQAYKHLSKFSWQKQSARPPLAEHSLPGKNYVPPGHIAQSAEERWSTVTYPAKHADDLRRIKWKGWPELKPKKRHEVVTAELKSMFETGGAIPQDLGDKGTLLPSQVEMLEKRGYNRILVMPAVQFASFLKTEEINAGKFFGMMDYNNSKSVSFSEFQGAAKKINFTEAALKDVYNFIDKGKDGSITKSDWHLVVELQNLIIEADVERNRQDEEQENKRMQAHERKRRQMEAQAEEFREQIQGIFDQSNEDKPTQEEKVAYFEVEFQPTEEDRILRKLIKQHGIDYFVADRLLKTFKKFDYDNSFAIEWPEFEPLLKCILTGGKDINYEPSKKMVQTFWQDIDEDGEGTISFEEFFNWIMRLQNSSAAFREIAKRRSTMKLEDMKHLRKNLPKGGQR